MKTLHLLATWACLSGATALAQTTLLSIDGSAPDERFGAAVAGPGDVNGDGVPDLAVGVPLGASGGAVPGVVRMFSGVDGGLLWETPGALTKTYFGNRMHAMDDVDADGVRELLVGTGPPGLALLSGSSGAVLWMVHAHPFLGFGSAFAGLDDLDGDGVSDFAVGVFISGSVEVLSGATQRPIHKWQGGLGYSIARADDLDGDGTDDVLAGWHDMDLQVLPRKVIAFSGSTKLQLFELVAPTDAVTWAWSMAADADLDGDGLPELAVSDPYHAGQSGRITVLRGSDHGVHFEVGGAPGMRLGNQIAYCGDVDGDGVADLLSGSDAAHGAVGVLRVYSGATGALVLELQGPADEGFAGTVAALGDLDGDGAQDVALGWRSATSTAGEVGRVIALAGPCPTPVSYCTAQLNSQGCASALGWSGSPLGLSGAPFLLVGSNLIPGSPGLAIYSLTGPNAVPALGGTLCVLPPFTRAPATVTTGSGACGGVLSFDFGSWIASGADPALVAGADVWAQLWSRDAQASSGSNLTDALAIQLGP